MAFIRWKTHRRDGKVYGPYAYRVRSVREGDRVRQVFVEYIGKKGAVVEESVSEAATPVTAVSPSLGAPPSAGQLARVAWLRQASFPPERRQGYLGFSLTASIEKSDIVGSIRKRLKEWEPTHREFRLYREFGTVRRVEPLNEAEVALARRHHGPPSQCFYNAQMALIGTPFEYVEGIVVPYPEKPFAVPHGWVEINGKVVELTLPDTKDGQPPEGAVYIGVPFAKPDVIAILAKEGMARAVALGPPRTKKRAREEDLYLD